MKMMIRISANNDESHPRVVPRCWTPKGTLPKISDTDNKHDKTSYCQKSFFMDYLSKWMQKLSVFFTLVRWLISRINWIWLWEKKNESQQISWLLIRSARHGFLSEYFINYFQILITLTLTIYEHLMSNKMWMQCKLSLLAKSAASCACAPGIGDWCVCCELTWSDDQNSNWNNLDWNYKESIKITTKLIIAFSGFIVPTYLNVKQGRAHHWLERHETESEGQRYLTSSVLVHSFLISKYIQSLSFILSVAVQQFIY